MEAKKKRTDRADGSFAAWAASLGDPGPGPLTAGTPVSKASFEAAQRLVGPLGANRDTVLALAASLDALPRKRRTESRRKVA